MPVRKLLKEAEHAIHDIKLGFMMRPLSVASYLALDCLTFDVVIFEEASQVRPEEACGSILRGRQIVIVGGHLQLLPTDHFRCVATDENEEEESAHEAADVEIILTLLSGRGMPITHLPNALYDRGVQVLQTFLQYAKTGRLAVPVPFARQTRRVDCGGRAGGEPGARGGSLQARGACGGRAQDRLPDPRRHGPGGLRRGKRRNRPAGVFLWGADMDEPAVRDRSQAADVVSRKMEQIVPEEIAAAIRLVLRSTRGLESGQLPNAVARCFGIQRLGEESRARIEAALEKMVSNHEVAISGRYAVAVE